MTHVRTLTLSFAALVVVSLCSSPASAAPAYKCRSDKTVDVPMQFTATVQGGRVRLSASGGSDKSGWIAPYNNGAWKVFHTSGAQVTRFTESLLAFASTEMLKESSLEGLLPGTYTIQLTSIDLCGNQGKTQRSVTIPYPAGEGNAPVVADLQVMQISSYGASAYSLYFTAADDSGIKRVVVEAGNGSVIAEFNYFDGKSYRWWTEFFPQDSTVTIFEGPAFYVSYDSAYKGQCGVRVLVEDLAGNQSVAAGNFCLP